MGTDLDELELVAQANAGKSEALETLYRSHRDWVVALARRFTGNDQDALDVLQETFAWFFSRFPGFQLTATLRAFLYPVVRHESVTLIRRRQKVVQLQSVREGRLEQSAPSWEPEVPGELERMISGLPEGHREVVRLRFVLGFRLPEIAAALGLPLGTVKSRLHHALAALRRDEEAKAQ